VVKLSQVCMLASTALLFAAAGAGPARAGNSLISTAHVLVCDTPEEIEAVLTSDAGKVSSAILKGKRACNIVTVAFVRGDEAKIVLSHDGIVHIFKINVVSVRTDGGWLSINKPMPQYLGELAATLSA